MPYPEIRGTCSPLRRLLGFFASFLAAMVVVLLACFAFVPALHETKWDGVWLKTSGEAWMPEQITIRVRHGIVEETLPAASEYVTFRLAADGREHEWIDPEGQPDRFEKTYIAQLTSDAFSLTTHTTDTASLQHSTDTEHWRLDGQGKDLVIANRDGQTMYRRVSWFRRLLRHAP
jgi:hypothetical protein